MRDRVAFHVDADVVENGLGELLKDNRDVVLCKGDGRKADDSSMTLGLEAQVNGLDMDLETYGKFVAIVSEDHGSAMPFKRLSFWPQGQQVFLSVTSRRARIMVVRGPLMARG